MKSIIGLHRFVAFAENGGFDVLNGGWQQVEADGMGKMSDATKIVQRFE